MSTADDRLTADCPLTVSSGEGVHVWQEQDFGKIWIATQSVDCQSDASERFVCIEVALREPESSAVRYAPESRQRSLSFGGCLSVNISTALLERAGICGRPDLPETKVIADPIAFELALGIVEAYSLPHIDVYTKCCMVKMLCAQLSETALACFTPSRRRNVGFSHWQRTRMEVTLSELGRREISLELVAKRCGLSVCHFARLFRMTYGMPFHQYIVQRKISRACSLLSETQESISQIALECGFADQSSFTRRFSAKTGTSPAAWRKGWHLQPGGLSFVKEVCPAP